MCREWRRWPCCTNLQTTKRVGVKNAKNFKNIGAINMYRPIASLVSALFLAIPLANAQSVTPVRVQATSNTQATTQASTIACPPAIQIPAGQDAAAAQYMAAQLAAAQY